MAELILQTKLYVPVTRRHLISRPHLIAKLNAGLEGKLSLISAPAGFGKTTLVSDWIAAAERPFAWLSLDQRDSDLVRFLTYLVAALQTVEPSLGERVLGMLETQQRPPTEILLTTLLNEITAVPNAFALVLDDYHVVEAAAIDQALTFLLEHLPPQMHLVITSREDPVLPLPRLRVRGLLTEIRAADLRFTVEETAVFLTQLTGLAFSAAEVASLEKRTEGWIAGLQLAALSMQGQADVHSFIEAFAGDDRYIVDYLVAEVLQHQPEPVRHFLLQTSILERFCAPLCEAVLEIGDWRLEIDGQSPISNPQSLLDYLERANLFLIPLDDKRHWYRYHHLFADVLKAYLMKNELAELPLLHQRASVWYEQNNLTAEAVHHAFAAADFERAARIIELAWAEMDRSRRSATWLGWANRVPAELVRSRPVLSVGCAWALLDTGELEAAEKWLQAAEHCLETTEDFVVADEVEFQHLPGNIAAARTYLALALNDLPGGVIYARQALNLLPADDHLRRGTPAALLGLAAWADGNLAEAQQSFAEAMTSYQKAGNMLFVITGAYVLAEMKLAQGRLREVETLYEQSLKLAKEAGEPVLRGAADLYTGLSGLVLEQNDLAAAKDYLRQSKVLGEGAALPRWRFRWCVMQAEIMAAEGDLDGALKMLDEAEQHYVRGPVPDVRPMGALKARVWLALGKLRDAQQWAQAQDLSVHDKLSYLRECEHITLARILITQYRQDGSANTLQEAIALLARLRQTAESDGRVGSMLEILVLQSVAYEAAGNMTAALMPLTRALALAEPEGYVRLFVGEGQPMESLLTTAVSQKMMPDYTSRLLAAFTASRHGAADDPEQSGIPGSVAQAVVEPLSEREQEVLQLVAQGLSNREIAERLFLALPTVKGHNRNIYSKLQVNRRTEAVARAQELGIL